MPGWAGPSSRPSRATQGAGEVSGGGQRDGDDDDARTCRPLRHLAARFPVAAVGGYRIGEGLDEPGAPVVTDHGEHERGRERIVTSQPHARPVCVIAFGAHRCHNPNRHQRWTIHPTVDVAASPRCRAAPETHCPASDSEPSSQFRPTCGDDAAAYRVEGSQGLTLARSCRSALVGGQFEAVFGRGRSVRQRFDRGRARLSSVSEASGSGLTHAPTADV